MWGRVIVFGSWSKQNMRDKKDILRSHSGSDDELPVVFCVRLAIPSMETHAALSSSSPVRFVLDVESGGVRDCVWSWSTESASSGISVIFVLFEVSL